MRYVNLYRDIYHRSIQINHFLRWAVYQTKEDAYINRLYPDTGYDYIRTVEIEKLIYEINDRKTMELFQQIQSIQSGIISYPTTL